MSEPGFWLKRDNTSMARSLRLAVVRNVWLQGLLSEADAREVLAGPLEPGNEATRYDDSRWLEWEPAEAVPDA